MIHKDAVKQLWKRGAAHATGDALRAMYAQLVCFPYWGKKLEPKFYQHLQKFATDQAVIEEGRALMRDHSRTLDVALGNDNAG